MHYPTHSTGFLVGVTKERLTEVSCLGLCAAEMEGYGTGRNQYDNPFNTGVALMKTDRGHICRCNKAGARFWPCDELVLGTNQKTALPKR